MPSRSKDMTTTAQSPDHPITLDQELNIGTSRDACAAIYLSEINHRVGGSLQLVASLIRRAEIEIKEAADGIGNVAAPTALDVLQSLHCRISTIAMVQRRLYGSTPKIDDIVAFAEMLMDDLRVIYDRPDVVLAIEEMTPVPDACAQTVGIIMCELISNALRHAFAAGEAGTIRLRMSRVSVGVIRILVADDGCGLSVKPAALSRRGLSLIADLAGDVSGTMHFLKQKEGAAWQIDLPFQ